MNLYFFSILSFKIMVLLSLEEKVILIFLLLSSTLTIAKPELIVFNFLLNTDSLPLTNSNESFSNHEVKTKIVLLDSLAFNFSNTFFMELSLVSSDCFS